MINTNQTADLEARRPEPEDWDLKSCLEYNAQDGFAYDDVQRILAVVEGEHDGADWHWVLWLKDGQYAYVVGGCDYTGWDCQSSAESWISDTALGTLSMPQWDDWDRQRKADAVVEIRRQLIEGKPTTRREQVGRELENDDDHR